MSSVSGCAKAVTFVLNNEYSSAIICEHVCWYSISSEYSKMCWRLNEKQNGHLPGLLAVMWLCQKWSFSFLFVFSHIQYWVLLYNNLHTYISACFLTFSLFIIFLNMLKIKWEKKWTSARPDVIWLCQMWSFSCLFVLSHIQYWVLLYNDLQTYISACFLWFCLFRIFLKIK